MVQPLDRDRLLRIAAFGDVFDAPGFSFGEWEPSRQTAEGAWTMPYYVFSSAAREFLTTLVVDPAVDWPAWASTEEAQRLRDAAALAGATPEQLVKLMTWIVRSDRFSEGSIAGAYESGVLRAIISRAADLAEDEGGQ
jgi:Family of unknown function (DUF6508)